MFIQKSSGGTDYAPAPAGTHLGVCYRVLDLGTQRIEYMGEVKKQRKLLIAWELPEEPMEDGKPFSISKKYTLSFHEKSALRADLESWRGQPFTEKDFSGPPNGFDLAKLLGAPALINVIHKPSKEGTKVFANIAAISRIKKGMDVPALVNEKLILDLNDQANPDHIIDRLGKRLHEDIKSSPEYQAIISGDVIPPAQSQDDFLNDDCPF